MMSYSAARDSRTRSSSCTTPVAMACTGVVAMRSKTQEGQNFDFPVISLPQREQNIARKLRGGPPESSGIAWRIARFFALSGAAGRLGREAGSGSKFDSTEGWEVI